MVIDTVNDAIMGQEAALFPDLSNSLNRLPPGVRFDVLSTISVAFAHKSIMCYFVDAMTMEMGAYVGDTSRTGRSILVNKFKSGEFGLLELFPLIYRFGHLRSVDDLLDGLWFLHLSDEFIVDLAMQAAVPRHQAIVLLTPRWTEMAAGRGLDVERLAESFNVSIHSPCRSGVYEIIAEESYNASTYDGGSPMIRDINRVLRLTDDLRLELFPVSLDLINGIK